MDCDAVGILMSFLTCFADCLKYCGLGLEVGERGV